MRHRISEDSNIKCTFPLHIIRSLLGNSTAPRKRSKQKSSNFFKSRFICNLYQYMQQIVYKLIQWHVEEYSVALQGLLWLLGIKTYKLSLKNRITNTTITLGIW
jgi:hypothetical protein